MARRITVRSLLSRKPPVMPKLGVRGPTVRLPKPRTSIRFKP